MTSPNLAGLIQAASEAVDFLTNEGDRSGFGTQRMEGVRFYEEAHALTIRLRAALRTVSDEPGAGWKLVPVEPTRRMLVAADGWTDFLLGGGGDTEARQEEFKLAWRVMLDAAPDPAIPADTQSREGEKL